MTGAVLNALNYRLDAASIAFILDHGKAKLLIADREFAPTVRDTLARLDRKLPVVEIADADGAMQFADVEYEDFLREGDPDFVWQPPADEWAPIALNYTSGTTGNPKGVVYHHRGAFLNAMGNAILFGLGPQSVYLWTLPMFHCNGWTYTWGVTAVAGTHVCLRRVDPAAIFSAIAQHRVTHLSGAPIVLNMLVHAPESVKRKFDHIVEASTGGAAPPSSVIEAMERMGFRITHLYGLTESYGPTTICAWQEEWDELPLTDRAGKMARQGVQTITLDRQRVVDLATMQDVPADGATIGEVVIRSNTLMKGYLLNATATEEAFAGGWFHTGDLAVMHPDGYVEVKDRSKDIIISGGENISSIEVEEVLYRHPQVMEAAVVAKPDEHWGETPCAFVTLKPDAGSVAEAEIIAFCRANMAHYKAPKTVVFGSLPKTSTGKIQKYALREQAKGVVP
jgi:fatty-acyl-CoA synthase